MFKSGNNKFFVLGFLAGLLFGLILVLAVGPFYLIGEKVELHLGGWHFHDSLYGVLAIIFGYFRKNKMRAFLFGLGVGVILQHTLREGFYFITLD